MIYEIYNEPWYEAEVRRAMRRLMNFESNFTELCWATSRKITQYGHSGNALRSTPTDLGAAISFCK